MKRFIFLLTAVFCFGICNAQIKRAEYESKHLDKYEYYLEKSTKFQTGALGSAAVAVGCFIGYACQKEKFEVKDYKSNDLKMKDTPKYLLIGGSIAAASAIVCELFAINYKLEAGKHLKLQFNGIGATASLRF